jgi:hypothetical protein
MMAHATKLSGPDFSVGIPLSDLAANMPVLGHAQGEAVLLVRTGSDVDYVVLVVAAPLFY